MHPRLAATLGALVSLAGCANGLIDPGPGDGGGSNDATVDVGPKDTGADSPSSDATLDAGIDAPIDVGVDGGCWATDSGLGGIGTPTGTTATATSSYSSNVPSLAVDLDPGTYWNAGGTSGSLTITFPKPQLVSGVRIATIASPASSETYTIYAISGSVASQIGTGTFNVPQGLTINPTIAVPPGTFDGIRVDVSSSPSWSAIAEVSVVTPLCP